MKKYLLLTILVLALGLTGCGMKMTIQNTNNDANLSDNFEEKINKEIETKKDETTESLETKNRYQSIMDQDRDYIYPESSEIDLSGWGAWIYDLNEFEIAKNEIFARYGHDFSNVELREYFESKSWYKAIPGKKVSVDELNNIEKKNVALFDKFIKVCKELQPFLFKYDENKPIIYNAAEGNEKLEGYKIPYINIDSNDVKEINQNSYGLIESILTSEDFVNCKEANYYYFVNDNILSVIANSKHEVLVDQCKVYNINIQTGNVIKNAEILEKNNISKDTLLDKIKDTYINVLKDRYKLNDEQIKNIKSDVDNYDYGNNDKLKIDSKFVFDGEIENNYSDLDKCLIYFDSENKLHLLATWPAYPGLHSKYYVDTIVEL